MAVTASESAWYHDKKLFNVLFENGWVYQKGFNRNQLWYKKDQTNIHTLKNAGLF